jgi:type I restriction enzyme S subunit
MVKSSACKMLSLRSSDYDLRFLYERMQVIGYEPTEHKRHWISTFTKFELALPSLDEQRAIAEVLSDMDAEIEALEKRLAKTKDLKTGMAQELLSGRTRLV